MTHDNRPDDWRRQGQEKYLRGLHWTLQPYAPYRDGWEHDHCEMCSSRLSAAAGDLGRGYVSVDGYRWVCEPCFSDFADELGWQVAVAEGD